MAQVVTGVKSGASTIDVAISSPETGTLYYVIYTTAPALPTPASIKTDASATIAGTIVRNGVVTVGTTEISSPLSKVITNLTENKTYYVYTVFENSSGTLSNIQNFTQVLPLRQPAMSYVATSASISGKTINYLLYKPEPYYKNPTKSYPLLLFFHGDGEKAPAAIDAVKRNGPTKVISDGVELDFIVASPQSQGAGVVDWLSPGFLDEFLEKMKTNNRVDISKVYITALSGGGGGLYYLSATQPSKIAALMPVSGVNSFWTFGTDQYCNIKDIPLWGFHNQNDGTVTVSNLNAVINGINACSPGPVVAPVTTIYNASGHDAWTQTYNNPVIYPWLLGKTKPDPLNKQPTVNAGTDVNLAVPANSITLTGTATDPDGTISTYEWRKMSGPDATIGNTNSNTLKVKDLKAGTYIFRFSVTDNKGSVNYDEVTIIVAANQPPNVNAGADKTLSMPVASSILTGTASDPDGTIAAYAWTQVSGPNTATLSGQNTLTLTISNLIAGAYTFRLTVTDDKGLNAYDDIIVTANAQPLANAGLDKIITLPTSNTTITGTASDPDGTIAAYAWTQVSGPNTATLGGSTTNTLSTSGLIQGVYVFRMTVTDNLGNSNYDDVNVTVNAAPPNSPPVVNAGLDKTITLPINTATFAGTASDPDGTIQSLLWTQVSGPNTATLSGQSTNTLIANNLITGTYVFRLTATDNKGASAFDEVSVIVNPAPPNVLPIANAGLDKTITLPTNSLTLTGTGTDSDGTIVLYTWTQQSGPTGVTLSGATTNNLSLSNLTSGTYIFRLTVTDNQAGTGFDEMTLIVNPEPINLAPVVDAGTNKTITLPTNTATFAGTASDPDGTIQSLLWTQVSGPNTATLSGQNTNTLTANNLITGTYVFRLTATDNKGASAFDEVSVIVNPEPVNLPPVANAGGNQSTTLPTNSIILNGSGSDPENGTISFVWTQTLGNTATLSGQNTNILSVSGLTAGTYKFKLTVTDNKANIGTDEMTLIVNPEPINLAPTANAGTDKSLVLPANTITLNGSASDPDGTIASYIWTQISGPNTATLSGQNTVDLSLSGLIEGSYVFRLTATDNKTASAFDEVSIFVIQPPANQNPLVNGGGNKTITLPINTATFAGTASDPDGTIQSLLWTQVSGPNTATLSGQNTNTLTANNLITGTYVFRLTATDNKTASAFDEVSLIVNPEPVNLPPVANAGGNQSTTLPTNSIILNGSGSDPENGTISFVWTQTLGNTATLSGQNTNILSVSGLTAGTYKFKLTVTDNKANIGTDEMTLIVNPEPVNLAPVVDAGTNKTITLPTNTTTFAGTASDPDGTIQSLLWTQVSGPNTATLSGQNTNTLIANNLITGTYVFRLTATDNKGASAFDEVSIIVNPEPVNLAPVVDAGTNKTITLPINTATFAGTASDPDGTIQSLLWTQVSGPNTATLSGQNTNTLIANNLIAGTYEFRLTATDNQGATGFNKVMITVNPPPPNQLPVVNAGLDKNITLPETATFTGTATDPDGTITAYVWSQISGPNTAALSGQNTNTLTANNLTAGTYVFRLTATDDKGASDFDEVSIIVNPEPANQLPTVSAGTEQTIKLPVISLTLTGTASDADGTISTYLWTKESGPAVTMTNTGAVGLILTDLNSGVYIFRLTVTDNRGGISFAEVKITVVAPNNTPVANAGRDTTVILPLEKIVLKGSAIDNDGQIVSFQWTNESSLPATLSNANEATLTLTDLEAGVYTLRLTVTDNDGSSSSDVVQVMVVAPVTASELKAKKVFSPNSDQIEDFWEIEKISSVPSARVLIFNERGKVIYTAQAPYTSNIVWDGKTNGVDVPEGAYYFVIKSEEKDIMAGSFILIR